MEENLKHSTAFEYYYSLGDSLRVDEKVGLVAGENGVSKKTIYQWKKLFKWDERKRSRDIKNAHELAKKTDTLVVDLKSKYLIVIKATLLDFMKAIKSGNIKYSVKDLETLAKLELLLMEGEEPAVDSVVNITIQKDDRV